VKKLIYFIVNPVSGIGTKNYLPTYIDKYLDHKTYDYRIAYTKAPRHATELTRKAVREGATIVVAVGGDGSVNEVVEGLIGTNTALGILPMGSGNAFATHWGISRRLKNAIELLNNGNTVVSDIAYVNNRLMIATSGVGFAAHVAYLIKGKRVRGFLRYIAIAVESALNYKSKNYLIQLNNDGEWFERTCFIAEISNTKYYGNGAQIAPPADAQDGLLNLTLVLDRPRFHYVQQLWRLWTNTLHEAEFIEAFTAESVQLILPHSSTFHRDGEGEFSATTILKYTVAPYALKIVCP
jgi:diacylglycerol kinase (ATP)